MKDAMRDIWEAIRSAVEHRAYIGLGAGFLAAFLLLAPLRCTTKSESVTTASGSPPFGCSVLQRIGCFRTVTECKDVFNLGGAAWPATGLEAGEWVAFSGFLGAGGVIAQRAIQRRL